MKENIRKEHYRSVGAMLKTELNSANKIDAINILPMQLCNIALM